MSILGPKLAVILVGVGLVAGGVREASAQSTETPQTVARGDWLLEADLIAMGERRAEGERERTWAMGYLQLTHGVGARWDFQLGLQAHERTETKAADGAREVAEGWGQATLRAKWWAVGAVDGRGEAAMLPYVARALAADAAGRREWEFGLIVPVGWRWSDGWRSEAQVQTHGVKEPRRGRQWHVAGSVNLQHAWNERWGGYVEAMADLGAWASTAVVGGAGVTCALPFDAGLDLAYYRRLRGEAADWDVALRLYWNL